MGQKRMCSCANALDDGMICLTSSYLALEWSVDGFRLQDDSTNYYVTRFDSI